jgi:undecaprenyl-diphosphatase
VILAATTLLTWTQAIVMGLLQGVTELFPVSSLGHAVLFPAWLGWHNLVSSQSRGESFFLAFLVGLHVGTAIGLLVYYRDRWTALVRGLARQLGRARADGLSAMWRLNDATVDADYRLLALLAVATVPVGLAGIALEHKLRTLFAKPLAAAIFLTINGLIMFASERLRRSGGRRAAHVQLATMKLSTAVWVGCTQILALFAGISRSGVTMAGGLMAGLDHEESADFAFLLATPVILLAGLYKIPDLLGPLGNGVRAQTLVGAVVAGVAAYFAVRFLAKWFTTKTLTPFAWYALIVGAISVVRFF